MQKIIPCLWFDKNAEEAVNFYLTVFNDGKITSKTYYPDAGKEIHGMDAGTVLTINFEVRGIEFLAMNGGPAFKFNEAISLIIECEDQKEIDYYWEKLSSDPKSEQCGWLKDKFGLSWQIVPKGMDEILNGDKETANRKMNALLQMKKIDIEILNKA